MSQTSQIISDRKHPPLSLAEVRVLAGELQDLCDPSLSSSARLILLNRFFVTVENYLTMHGMTADRQGYWLGQHWGYRLLQHLADHVEVCKRGDVVAFTKLLRFVEQQLLPRLEAQLQSLA